jgi:beta-glucosidase-like glycosyl hydrolase
MGGVLSAAPVGEASTEFICAGGDLCLVCHREDHVLQAYEALSKAADSDKKLERRSAESTRRVLAFKKKWAKSMRVPKSPDRASIEKLTRRLWEFSERVRIEDLSRRNARPRV